MTRGHQEHEQNVAPYLLGALPELEAQLFERHLMGCVECGEEAERLAIVVDALALSAEPVSPPASLRPSLMTALAEIEPAAPEPAASRVSHGASEVDGGVRPQRLGAASLRRLWRLRPVGIRRPARGPAAWVAATCLVAVMFGAGFGVARLIGQGDSRTLAAQVDRGRLPSAQGSLAIPDGRRAAAVLRVRKMPRLSGDRVYQVWLKRGQTIVPASAFTVRSDGTGTAGIGESLRGIEAILVTRERAGGATAPTEAPLMQVDLRS